MDSGNLAGHLLTLAQGCREAARQPAGGAAVGDGLADTYTLLSAALAALTDERRTLTVTLEELRRAADQLSPLLAPPPPRRPHGDIWN